MDRFDKFMLPVGCVGLYCLLMPFALAVRVKVNTVSSVNPQFTATLHYFFTNDSVSKSKSKCSNHSNLHNH